MVREFYAGQWVFTIGRRVFIAGVNWQVGAYFAERSQTYFMIITTNYPLPNMLVSPNQRLWIYGTGEIAQSYFEQIKRIYGSDLIIGFT